MQSGMMAEHHQCMKSAMEAKHNDADSSVKPSMMEACPMKPDKTDAGASHPAQDTAPAKDAAVHDHGSQR